MGDSEKIIKGVLHCILSDNCGDCPYAYSEMECFGEFGHDIVTLAEQQKPVNVNKEINTEIVKGSKNVYVEVLFHCPKCNKVLSVGNTMSKIKYCYNCGQRVKWE